MTHLTYLEAAVVGLVQGVTELFPISSLGHNVLLPALVGGSWEAHLDVASPESPYLAFIVGLHVATALALLVYFWRDWVRIVGGFVSSIRERRVETTDQRLAWMIVLATIPVGIVGLVAEHPFRVIFGKPIAAAVFLAVNGVILIAGERYRRRESLEADEQVSREAELVMAGGQAARLPGGPEGWPASPGGRPASLGGPAHARPRMTVQPEQQAALASDRRLSVVGFGKAIVIGSAQILALLAGISRDGVTMVAGMRRGLAREDAARFAFLLSTPVILAAGVLKIPDLFGPLGSGIGGQILLGSVLSFVGAYFAVRFLVRYLRTNTLYPFGIYCLVAGLASAVYLGFVK
jgi:undecaprenyl-diphosphatase